MIRKHGITLFQLALLLVATGLLLAAFFCYAEWSPVVPEAYTALTPR